MKPISVLVRRCAHASARATLQAETSIPRPANSTRSISSSQRAALNADNANNLREKLKESTYNGPREEIAVPMDAESETMMTEMESQLDDVKDYIVEARMILQGLPPPQHYLTPEAHRDPKYRAQPEPSQLFTGTVSRVGTMPHCIQVTRQVQVWDSFIKKYYTRPERLLVHDPSPPNFLREGDIIEYGTFLQKERDDPKQWRIFEQTTAVSAQVIARKEAQDMERVKTEMKNLGIQDEEEYREHKAKELRIKKEEEIRAVKKKKRKGLGKKGIKPVRLGVSKIKGVQFVARRVVTPFGEDIETRLANLAIQSEQAKRVQPQSARGGQNTLLRGRGGNMSRNTGRASVAGRAKVPA